MATFNPAKKKIRARNISTSSTTLVTFANTLDEVYALNFCNTSAVDVTVDCWAADASSNKYYLFKTQTVPANGGVFQWTGSVMLDASSEIVACLCSAANSVDVNGGYLEYT